MLKERARPYKHFVIHETQGKCIENGEESCVPLVYAIFKNRKSGRRREELVGLRLRKSDFSPGQHHSATDKQYIWVFTQLKCLKTQLRFSALRTEKQKKSSIRKSDYFLCLQPYNLSKSCLPNCACTCE